MVGTQETWVPSSWEKLPHIELRQISVTETHFLLESFLSSNKVKSPGPLWLQFKHSSVLTGLLESISFLVENLGVGGGELREMELGTTGNQYSRDFQLLNSQSIWNLFTRLNKCISAILETPGIPSVGFCWGQLRSKENFNSSVLGPSIFTVSRGWFPWLIEAFSEVIWSPQASPLRGKYRLWSQVGLAANLSSATY